MYKKKDEIDNLNSRINYHNNWIIFDKLFAKSSMEIRTTFFFVLSKLTVCKLIIVSIKFE